MASDVKPQALTVRSGKGKELCDLLRRELGIPELVTGFTVKFEMDDVVRVNCDYLPTERPGE